MIVGTLSIANWLLGNNESNLDSLENNHELVANYSKSEDEDIEQTDDWATMLRHASNSDEEIDLVASIFY